MHGRYTAGMRVLAVLLALLVPAGQVLAAMHLHCALEHSLGRVTPHAAGEAGHSAEDHHSTGHDDPAGHPDDEHHPGDVGHGHTDGHDGYNSEHVHDDSRATMLFDDHHHHHHGGATSSHAGCCIGGAGGAMLCCIAVLGVDVRAEQFALPMPTGAYNSPYHEPPPRPQWLADAPA
jgi:hypothetical protein